MIKKAFDGLGMEKRCDNYHFKVRYSGRFNSYNANVRLKGKEGVFNLSKEWLGINEEIVIGLLQTLIKKLFKVSKKTYNIELYNNFIRKIPEVMPKEEIDEELEESFERVNEYYFDGLIGKPNLVWGRKAITKLGSYDFHTDTIVVSSFLRNLPVKFVDYVMYHEMLHKKHSFKVGRRKNFFHTKKFREEEKSFLGFEEIEKELQGLIRGKKMNRNKEVFFNFLKKKIYK